MREMSAKTWLKIFINTIIGGCLILLWLRFVDLDQIIATISGTSVFLLLPAFIFMFLSAAARSIRLKFFLAPVKEVRVKDLFFLTGVAMMLNFLIPIRAGEVAKGIYLSTQYGLSLGRSIIWIFLDRFVDFCLVLLLVGGLLLVIPNQLPLIFGLIFLLTSTLILIVAYFMAYNVNFSQKILKFLSHLLIFKSIKIYFERIYTFFLDAFTILKRSPGDWAKLTGLTILAYATDGAIWYFTFLALGFPQDYLKMYLGQLLSALTYLIPAAPGYVGSAEASGLLILSGVFGLEPNLASSMIVLFHVLSLLFVAVFGVISVYGLKIDLKSILRKALRREN